MTEHWGERAQQAIAWSVAVTGGTVRGRIGGRMPAAVWALTTPNGPMVLKLVASADGFAAEARAYERWSSELRGAMAEVVAAEPALGALVLTALPGARVRHPSPSTCEAAGDALSRLRAADPARPVPADEVAGVLGGEAEAWLSWAGPWLGEEERRQAQAVGDQAAELRGWTLGACHGDYDPRNWLEDAGGRWSGMVDFEHARNDLAEHDVAALLDGALAGNAPGQAALLRGWGSLDAEGRARLDVVRTVVALARLVSGRLGGDVGSELRGRSALQSLRRPPGGLAVSASSN